MAHFAKRVPKNVLGEFFVDTTCIDCDTCRQLAPATFEDAGDHSFVYAQPHTTDQRRKALRALLACPTGSIGTQHANSAKEVMADFPLPLEDGVYYTGFNSPKSYGGNSYFVQHPRGNWLIDSPKYLPHLIRRFVELGGIRYIFLTHRDDVAEAHKYAKQFASQRIIHRAELSAQPDAEIVLEGHQSAELSRSLRLFRRLGTHVGTACCSTSSDTCSPEITCGGVEGNNACGLRGNIAGIHGPSKRSRWRSCGILPLTGCYRAMDNGSTSLGTSCRNS